jgi:plastocyanin
MPLIILSVLILVSSVVVDTSILALKNSTDSTQRITVRGNMTVGAHNNVSIVPEAASLDDKAFSPNPVDIKVGDTIVWTNDDISSHTITEGNQDSNIASSGFDSGLLSQGQNFTHTFDKAGIIEYFCQLHPQMVGKVIVSSQE